MTMQATTQTYLIVSAAIFGLVALIHLVRAASGWAFVLGPMTIPISASWIGFLVTAALCFWAIRLATS
jgi:hypothetical protein